MSSHVLFRWEVEALLLQVHPHAHATETGAVVREWWRHHSVEDDRKVMAKMRSFEFGLDQRREKVCLGGCLCPWFPLQRVDRPATVHLKIAQDSKNTDLKWSLITGTTRCSGNRSEIFQWAGEKSYRKSKNKYSQLHPHRTCFMFYSQGGIKTNKYIQLVYIKVPATLCNIYDIIFKHFWIVWNIHD